MDPETNPTEELDDLEVEERTSSGESSFVTQIEEFVPSINGSSSDEIELEDVQSQQDVQCFHPEMFTRNGEFGLVLISWNNELNTRSSRKKNKLAILSLDIGKACMDLTTFIPTNPRTPGNYKILLRILKLATGSLRLINFKLEHYIVNALSVVNNFAARRRAIRSPSTDEDHPHGNHPKIPQRKRRQSKTRKHKDDSIEDNEAEQLADETVQQNFEDPLYSKEVEEILNDFRQPLLEDPPAKTRRRKKQSQASMETKVLRKVRELLKMRRDENLMIDAPTVREMDQFGGFDEPFYGENDQPPNSEDLDNVALEVIRNSRIFRENEQANVDLSMIPTPQQTFILDPHEQTPPAADPSTAPPIVDDAVMKLEPLDLIEKPIHRKRHRSQRRVSIDEEKTLALSTINANIQETKKFTKNDLINRARKQRAEINPEKKGLEAIMHSGRKILSKDLEDAVKIRSKIPKIETINEISPRKEPESLGTKKQTAQLGQKRSVLKPDQFSVPIGQPTEPDYNDLNIGPDESSVPPVPPVLDSVEPSPGNQTLSLVTKSSDESETGTIEFNTLLSKPTTKLEAARMFTNLLSLQAKRNIELVQTQFYGQLEVKLLNKEDEPTQQEDCRNST